MKITKIVLFALYLLWGASAQAEMRYIFDLPLVGSELDGPKPTDDWDLSLNRGLSVTPGLGVQFDQEEFQFDILLEWFNHTSFPLIGDDELEVNGYLVKFIGRAKVDKNWRVFAGIGFGNADVTMALDNCRTYSGCSFSPWQYPEVSGSAGIRVFMFGVSLVETKNLEYFLGYERVKSDALGFRDVFGTPYAVDKLNLPAAIIGMRFYF